MRPVHHTLLECREREDHVVKLMNITGGYRRMQQEVSPFSPP
jgi:hypothetical protein